MALLVPNIGELESLRYLVNQSNHTQALADTSPKNLVLKLFCSNTTPAEGDVPTGNGGAYYEPYNSAGTGGYGSAPVTAYPAIVNTRENQDYSQNYGILLNGSRWTISTASDPVASSTGSSGTSGAFQITLTGLTGTPVIGNNVSGTGIGTGAKVSAVSGTTITLDTANSGTVSGAISFTGGVTTASYPEQTFTFSGAAGSVYGYFVARANNMPVSIHGVSGQGTAAAATAVNKTNCIGVIGATSFTIPLTVLTSTTYTGSSGSSSIVLDSTTATAITSPYGHAISGTGIPFGTKVIGKSGTTVFLDKTLTAGSSGQVTITLDNTQDITIGMRVTSNAGNTGPNGVSGGRTVVGIDRKTAGSTTTATVYVDSALSDNIQSSNNNASLDFNFSTMTTTAAHGLVPGDVIYIARAGSTNLVESTYTIFSTPSTTTFNTTPALYQAAGAGAVTGTCTLYSSIMYAERFTNGPYLIQNNGDQIKVTLNISLN